MQEARMTLKQCAIALGLEDCVDNVEYFMYRITLSADLKIGFAKRISAINLNP